MSQKTYPPRAFHGPLTKTQLNHQGLFTRSEGAESDTTNRKPFRTKAGKARARDRAWRDERGIWHSDEPVQYQ